MHSSSAQRLQRIRVITSNLLKSMHGFRLLSLHHGARIRMGILFVILVLVGGQILLWRASVSRMVAQALQAPTQQEVRAPAKELIAPLSQSPITRIEVPAADIYTSVVGIGPVTAASQQGTTWQLSRFAMGHYYDTGKPGQGKNIIFSAESGTQSHIMALLDYVRPGSLITLYVGDTAYSYTVTKQVLIQADTPNLASWIDQHLLNQVTGEQVTLITDWPSSEKTVKARYLMVVATPTP
jgi:sortase (surface protein transpeptidase)